MANVLNGPSTEVNTRWKRVIDDAAASGKTILGYVSTGYLGFAGEGDEFSFLTRLGSLEASDWVAQIEGDVDLWYSLYPGSIGGIFFDEGWNNCGATDNNDNRVADIYAHIDRYTKSKYPGAFTVLNPGAPTPKCYEGTMDTLITYEGPYDDPDRTINYLDKFSDIKWEPTDIRKIWHIVYQTPESAIDEVARLALQRNAGLLHMTNDIGGPFQNPYDNLPDDSYMMKQLASVEGGEPLVETKSFPDGPAAATPDSLTIVDPEYTSVKIEWSASSNALGYQIYIGSKLAVSVPPTMTEVTVGGLTPGTSYSFSVAAIGGGGVESARSTARSTSTLELPGGQTITNLVSTPSADSTTIEADVVVPYATLRLFFWDEVNCDANTVPAWSVSVNGTSVCARYMLEGRTLYHYIGEPPYDPPGVPWLWDPIATGVEIARSGYTYTWSVPLGTSTFDTTKFVVQAEGLGPATTVSSPAVGA